MASDPGFVQHVCDHVRGIGDVSYRKMFGEYAVYVGTTVVGLVCDDRLFLKPTDAGRALLGTPVEAPPYPGARPYFVLDEHVDDSDLLAALFSATAAALPASKKRKPKSSGGDAKRR